MHVRRLADVPRVRWRNDGGFTREIVSEPADTVDFVWRVSVAEVDTSGAFSEFHGCDRILVLLDGAGMYLRRTDNDLTVTVQPEAPITRFAGDEPICAELIDGPTTDFNLIWRRDLVNADAHCRDGCDEVVGGGAGEVAGGYVMRGLALVNDVAVPAGEAFLGNAGEALHLECDGRLVHFLVGPIKR